ncbi:hypothetical protein [Geobacter sp.]|uniref:hypothetical protein n=1 Tax=Geobacter sp. TaxID=46610 RepID=UPI002608EC38|nr:hypothetical protein [Geobacter sp.]
MRNRIESLSQKLASLRWFLVELVVYAIFVVGYFFLVLHLLGEWLKQVFDENKNIYALVALALIIVQGVTLEVVTSALLRVIRRKVR